MKTKTILCTAIAATMGLGTLAQAQDTRQERREARQEAREEARQEARQDARQEQRRDRLEARRVPDFVNTPLANVRDPEPHQQRYYGERAPQRHYDNHYAPQRHYNYAPQRHYNHAPQYYGNAGPRFYRGGYLPHSYRQPTYYVNWRAYPSRLYAPPYGYQWVHVGDEFLLIALASGLIATTLAM